MKIGPIEIPCAVLEDGTRVLSRVGFLRALGRTGKAKGGRRFDGESQLPVFLSSSNLKTLITKELTSNSKTIIYRPVGGGLVSLGYRADLLPPVCNVFIDADNLGLLKTTQKHLAQQCRILRDGFTVVGINALVDEATGYQRDRAADALSKILEAFVAKELRKWVSTFPPDFYEEMFRLRKLRYEKATKRPQYIGKLTNDLVYARLAPGVLTGLQVKNPSIQGRRKHKHFQWLTPDIGNPKLVQHLLAVTALMRASETWDQFKGLLDRAFKPYKPLPLFDQKENEISETK